MKPGQGVHLVKDVYGGLHVFINDGSGHFIDGTAAHLPATNREAWRPYLRDLDGDGDLEVFIATVAVARGIFNGYEEILENDGSGHFSTATPRYIADLADGASPMADFGDVDGDGDLDVVLADSGGGQYALGRERLYLNLTRQIYAYGSASLGKPYDLTIYGKPGQLAIPFLGAATQSSPIPPFGTFGLPLQSHLVLPSVTLTAIPGQPSMGRGTCRVPLPQDPFLLNRTIYSQALLVEPSQPLASRLTNVTADVVR